MSITQNIEPNKLNIEAGAAPKISKIEEAFSKYNLNIDDKAVQEAVRTIIAEKVPQNDTIEVKKFLMGSIELTTLKTTDSDTSVMAFTERVNAFDEQYPDLPHVATICVYPCFASIVAVRLGAPPVRAFFNTALRGLVADAIHRPVALRGPAELAEVRPGLLRL